MKYYFTYHFILPLRHVKVYFCVITLLVEMFLQVSNYYYYILRNCKEFGHICTPDNILLFWIML